MRQMVIFIVAAMMVGCVPVMPHRHAIEEGSRLLGEGMVALRRGELHQADTAFRLAWELTQSPQALDGRGCVALLRGDIDEARQWFTALTTRFPDYLQGQVHLGMVYEKGGDLRQAEALYRRVLTLDRSNVSARMNLIAVQYRLGKVSREQVEEELRGLQLLDNQPFLAVNLQRMR